jgi:uncharacterized protein YigA (DUF484 family)
MIADEIAKFLRAHPEFFERHPELLEAIQVPHPHGGRAIPLAERQLLTLREKAKLLEGKLVELIRIGEDNDAIGEKVHRLSLALLGARDFRSVANALYFHLREDFAVPHVALRVWEREGLGGEAEAEPVDQALRDLVATMGAPQCGPAPGSPFVALFPQAREHLRSLAVVPLGQTRTLGLLALASEDPQRFYAEMGTLYLRRIGELAAGALFAHR